MSFNKIEYDCYIIGESLIRLAQCRETKLICAKHATQLKFEEIY